MPKKKSLDGISYTVNPAIPTDADRILKFPPCFSTVPVNLGCPWQGKEVCDSKEWAGHLPSDSVHALLVPLSSNGTFLVPPLSNTEPRNVTATSGGLLVTWVALHSRVNVGWFSCACMKRLRHIRGLQLHPDTPPACLDCPWPVMVSSVRLYLPLLQKKSSKLRNQ